jgi:hypothetical protein
MKILILLFLLLSCVTTKAPIMIPPDVKSIIQEIEDLPELKNSPFIKKQIIDKLKESAVYNQNCYNQILEIENENVSLKEKLSVLNEELKSWRVLKKSFWISISFVILAGIGIFLWKARKLLGSPI